MKDFLNIMWLFNIDNTTRDIIRLNIDEAALLWKYAEDVRTNEHPIRILEIGRYWGGSTVLLLLATDYCNEPVEIISIDIIDGCHDPRVDEWLQEYYQTDRLELIVGDSRTLETETLSLLFIDGDHSYEGVKADTFQHWNSLDGFALFHDYQDETTPGVTKFLDEFVEQGYAEKVEQVSSMLVLKKLKEI